MSGLILVNEFDEEVGTAEMLDCHSGRGVLHRAFTIFVFDPGGRVLIQRRSEGKYLWPGFWEASCSGHPTVGEDLREASEKRLGEELGIRADLEVLDRFRYQVAYRDIGSENELCYLLAGECDGEVKPDPEEVAEYRWVATEELDSDITADRDAYAPWLVIGLELLEANMD